MKRRTFLAALASTGMLSVTGTGIASQQTRVSYLSARADRQRRYFASGIDAEGRLLFDLRLPARAHAIALHPERDTAVAIARRPGTFLQAIDLQTGRLLERIESLGERHFYGHGVFSHDGRYLYTTENSIETGRGTIGVREVESGYRLVDEFDSGGIGPHELCLMPDQRTLVVANGGIRTHPDFDRTPLNLTSMQPCLTYIDRTNGKHLETTRLPDRLHQNSIRHLAVGESGRVWIAMQYQGTKEMTPPLVAMHRRGHPLRLLMPPQAVLTAMRNYCGSVCADLSGHLFAVSSPRGNLVSFWSEEGDYLNSVHIKDGCGIASARSPGEFLLSSGEGGLYLYSIRTDELRRLANSPKEDFAWDNHLTNLLL